MSKWLLKNAENDQNYFLNLQFLSTSDPINPSSSINPKVALRFPEGHQVAGGPPWLAHMIIICHREQYMRGCSSDPGRPWVQHLARSKALECFGHVWTVWAVCLGSIETAAVWSGRCCCQGTGDVSDAITWAKKQSDSQRSGPYHKASFCRSYSEIFLKMLGDCWMV